MNSDKKILSVLISFILLIFILVLYFFQQREYNKKHEVLKVGILFSMTGAMAKSEKPVINAILLAIEEINAQGGINNKIIVPVIYDGQSNWKKYAQLGKKLILQDKVNVIFGCWTSAARKEIKPIVEKYDNLLVYPTRYEGVESSKNIIYLGATPNQQMLPAISWTFDHIGKRVFLVGTDSIFAHVANEIIKHEVESRGGEVLGEQYIPLGSKDVDSIIQDILIKKPSVIFNNIIDDTNLVFFERLHELTKGGSRPPAISFGLPVAALEKIGTKKIVGDYNVLAYIETQESSENKKFLDNYQKKYGSTGDINSPAVTAYAGIYLWKQAVEKASLTAPPFVREHMLRQSTASPAGVIYIDSKNANAWRTINICQFNKEGHMDVIWTSVNPIEPIVYPDFKKKAEWDFFEYQLYLKWKNSWENI